MSNEQFLIVSYFTAAAICIGLGAATYLWFRRPLEGIAAQAPSAPLARLLRRVFSASVVGPAVLGFLSVSYYSCNVTTYEQVIASQSYLFGKNEEQVQAALFYVLGAILVWGFLNPFFLSPGVAARRVGGKSERVHKVTNARSLDESSRGEDKGKGSKGSKCIQRE